MHRVGNVTVIVPSICERTATGAWQYNRPCAQQYVGKSQSCMVQDGQLIPHASYAWQFEPVEVISATADSRTHARYQLPVHVDRVVQAHSCQTTRGNTTAANAGITTGKGHALRVRGELIGRLQPCMTEIYLHIVARMADYIATHP